MKTDGSRYDSHVVFNDTNPPSPTMRKEGSNLRRQSSKQRNLSRKSSRQGSSTSIFDDNAEPSEHTWHPLVEETQFEEYHMSISGDPSRRKRLLPSAVAKTKFRYLLSEVFVDLYPGGRDELFTFDFCASLFTFLCALWVKNLNCDNLLRISWYLIYFAPYTRCACLFIIFASTYSWWLFKLLYIHFKYSLIKSSSSTVHCLYLWYRKSGLCWLALSPF